MLEVPAHSVPVPTSVSPQLMLQVYEGQSHAQFYRDDTAPEAKEAFEEIAGFFDKHLGK